MASILVVDDKASMRKMLQSALEDMKHKPKVVSSGSAALVELKKQGYDLVLTDVRMPDLNGMDLLKEMRRRKIDTQVVVMTAFGTIETAVEAMKLGAVDYLTKPFSIDHLKLTVDKALKLKKLNVENKGLRQALDDLYEFDGVPGESKAMRKVHQLVSKVARTDSVVLVQGESGTGKELVARAIHQNSRRKGKPFLKVNCAALAQGVLESELFGHEKGAFTGATERRLGRFELADGGTLFLDEIGDFPMASQVRLLRVLQEKEFERVEGTRLIKTNVRVIAASNQDLQTLVEQEKFREDLYFRLNVVPVQLPPLRDRPEDLEPLARHFIQKHCREARRPRVLDLSPDALKRMKAYPFPGNIRELENIIQRAMVLVEDDDTQIDGQHLPADLARAAAGKKGKGARLSREVADLERDRIIDAMKSCQGSQTRAARELGIKRTLLIYKLKKYKIKASSFKPARKKKPAARKA